MPNISPEIVNRISSIQNQIWQTVSLTVSESMGSAINFGTPLTVATSTADLYAELGSPRLVIQFAFANLPENPHVLLLPTETFAELAEAVKGSVPENIDENLISEIRPALEAIVQGMCLAVGNIKNEPTVASGLSMRFQILSFPPNMQRTDELMRTNIAVSGTGINGTMIWLLDDETAHAILNIPMDEEGEDGNGGNAYHGAEGTVAGVNLEDQGLEILLDIPLEISVELGRVKMLVRDVVELGSGSIVEIDKAAGEPVDVLVNGRLVARGEVVVIEDNFGVRITEILSPEQRVAKLNEVA
ncbi:MAG TPA: flagellar motor switch protein FliN [Fimbriimonadaceae bacterium]|nr:flagellar motor switch protein FliN [Fimbriimonadaceae bacterium]